MNEIEKSRIEEIRRLHDEIFGSFKISLEKAIRIGQLLTEQKEGLKHGEFTAWVNDNLSFSDRTARNYMRVYQGRDRLKTETVSGLTTAYQSLIEHKPKNKKAVRMIENRPGQFIEYTDTIRKAVFYMDCELVWYLRLCSSDDEIYQTLEEVQERRQREHNIPVTLNEELFSIIKATVEDYDRRAKIWMKTLDEQSIRLPFKSWEKLICETLSEIGGKP